MTVELFILSTCNFSRRVPGKTLELHYHINNPKRCLKGIMLFFLKTHASGERDSEEFFNPLINSVNVNVDGVPHKTYSDGILREDTWTMIKKRFDYIDDYFKEINFHDNKFALWIDLRSTPDNNLHGDGVRVGGAKSGVKLVIDIGGVASTTVDCYVFTVSDAALMVQNGAFKQLLIDD